MFVSRRHKTCCYNKHKSIYGTNVGRPAPAPAPAPVFGCGLLAQALSATSHLTISREICKTNISSKQLGSSSYGKEVNTSRSGINGAKRDIYIGKRYGDAPQIGICPATISTYFLKVGHDFYNTIEQSSSGFSHPNLSQPNKYF
jgi:hypothetical protein